MLRGRRVLPASRVSVIRPESMLLIDAFTTIEEAGRSLLLAS